MSGRPRLVALLAVFAMLAGACGSSPSVADAPPVVDGAPELPPALEAGAPSTDGGTTLPEASPRADVPSVACGDTAADVYVTPAGLPPMSMAARGAVVRCAKDEALDTSEIAARLSAHGVSGITATSQTTVYRIAFRTYREDGVPGVSTARVYLPTTPRSLPLPVVAVAHPTVGIADGCAPSKDPQSLSDLALPWAARGFAVIAPDYAGLGNEGVQGYAANRDTAHSLLDAARALRVMLAPGALDDRVLLAGFSQGGGAVLAAQSLAASYGAGGTVVAAIAFAPQLFSRLGSFGYVSLLRAPQSLTITTGVSKPVVAALRSYAIAAKLLGAAGAGATFPEAKRAGLEGAIVAQCQTPFGGYLQAVAPHLGDLFDETFRTSILACIDGASGCTGLGSQVHAWLEADLVSPDPAGAPVLYVQGLADTIMPPAEEAACNVALMKSAGVNVQVCIDPASTHTAVVPRNAAMALAWGEAKLDGKTLPACASLGMPPCLP